MFVRSFLVAPRLVLPATCVISRSNGAKAVIRDLTFHPSRPAQAVVRRTTNVTYDRSLQFLSIRHDPWHRRCFVSMTGHPCLRQWGTSMKSELIILRGLYAMTALVVVFGICALVVRVH
jgi:hypothetical protein